MNSREKKPAWNVLMRKCKDWNWRVFFAKNRADKLAQEEKIVSGEAFLLFALNFLCLIKFF